jgi:type IV secretory pathway VirB3-like protein
VQDGGGSEEIQQRAANAYAIWPLAVLDLFREPAEATAWSRLHTRQAFVFGIAATLAYLVLLALPLLILIAVPPLASSLTAVVWLYAVGLLADVIGAFVLVGLMLSYRERTLRGELFSIPYVTPIADRLFRIER